MIDQDVSQIGATQPEENNSSGPPPTWIPKKEILRDPSVSAMLLPKKDASLNSSRREDASVLFTQEQSAATQGLQTPKAPPIPTAVSTPQALEEVPRLQTYKHDIENMVSGGQTSVISIAAAEAKRRSVLSQDQEASQVSSSLKKAGMVLGGLGALFGAAIVVFIAMQIPRTVSPPRDIASPFITVDTTQIIPIEERALPKDVMRTLTDAQSQSLSIGLMERLLITVATTSDVVQEMDSHTFLSLISRTIPQDFVRTLSARFLLALYSTSQNEALLMFHVDSYERAYAGMLAWEPNMQRELMPLFAYTPPTKARSQQTSSSTPQLINSPFYDAVVGNHDARVVRNSIGDIVLLWTFLDKQTLLITNSELTIAEVISRLQRNPGSADF